VRILLDTHIALWAVADSPRLPAAARTLVLATENRLFVSAASIWEIAIKHGIAPAKMPVSGARALALFQQSGYAMLPIAPGHAAAIDDLPPHHADPFDRMLVAQALYEPLRLLTADASLSAYSDTIIVV
jgi:PIN domain nuclease of toxin-antitoxin system